MQRFCHKGHDTLVTGRTAQNRCCVCRKLGWTAQNRTKKARYSQSVHTARKRGLEWAISRPDFYRFLDMPCFYCGGPLNSTSCGLDRVDNSKGYTPWNVVPCCKVCNVMKNNLTREEFLNRVDLISSRLVKVAA